MPLLISALWAAIQLLPFSSQRQWDPFVSCQHKHPVIGGPEDVQYWISAVLPHTALAITKEGLNPQEAVAVGFLAPEYQIHRSLLVLQWPTIQILKGEEHRKDRQRLWGPSGSWDACGRLIPAGWQVPPKLLYHCPPQLGKGAKRKQKSHESRAGRNHLPMTIMGKRDSTWGN